MRATARGGTIRLHFGGSTNGWTTQSFIVGTPPPPHDFSLTAGRKPEHQIVLCSRCGIWKYRDDDRQMDWLTCDRLEGPALRDAFEGSIRRAQRQRDMHYHAAAGEERPRPSGPAYQNVSAAIHNVVGGWNRRGK